MLLPADLSFLVIALLCLASLLAGFVDAVVGGGGLIQVPALLGMWPQAPLPTLLGTNKLSSVWGTLSAALRYARHLDIPWRITKVGSVSAFIGSYIGAWAITQFPGSELRPLIPIALSIVAWQVYRRPQMKAASADVPAPSVSLPLVGLGCLVIGFYDGFFGPGTGSFLIFFLVRYCHLPFLTASASSKFINLTTNVAALLGFALVGHINWPLGLLMAVFNIAGAQLGSHMAIVRGSNFVRGLFLTIVIVLILKTGWDSLKPWIT